MLRPRTLRLPRSGGKETDRGRHATHAETRGGDAPIGASLSEPRRSARTVVMSVFSSLACGAGGCGPEITAAALP